MQAVITSPQSKITQLNIEGRIVGIGSPCFLVAEIGINHNGDIELAKKTILAAKEAGADAVKFQSYQTEDFITNRTLVYEYENSGRKVQETQFDMFKRCELTFSQLKELKLYCDQLRISFHSTPTSREGIADLVKLGAAVLKNGSDYLTHLPLIRDMGRTGLTTVLSTGMATLEEIDQAVRAFRETGNTKLILLACTSSYPTAPRDVNLLRIATLRQSFDCLTGFSDHTDGIVAAVGSVILGSVWLEKHFTLDKNLPGPDHRFSCDADEFQALARSVREMEKMVGSSSLQPTETEAHGRRNYRLSCQTTRDLPEGHVLTEADIAFRRPGTGIPPAHINYILGRKLARALSSSHTIKVEDLT
ncbi:MAG: N-acetylneuraminate synthase family protein [Candidatus Obscuribacter sp.]|nr:N-acetylneuraminate synthase family protein [Candidatus Obscuribacter sp.]